MGLEIGIQAVGSDFSGDIVVEKIIVQHILDEADGFADPVFARKQEGADLAIDDPVAGIPDITGALRGQFQVSFLRPVRQVIDDNLKFWCLFPRYKLHGLIAPAIHQTVILVKNGIAKGPGKQCDGAVGDPPGNGIRFVFFDRGQVLLVVGKCFDRSKAIAVHQVLPDDRVYMVGHREERGNGKEPVIDPCAIQIVLLVLGDKSRRIRGKRVSQIG